MMIVTNKCDFLLSSHAPRPVQVEMVVSGEAAARLETLNRLLFIFINKRVLLVYIWIAY